MKRTISIIVVLLLTLSLFAACTPKKTYSVNDFVDNSAKQQRWLRSPLSTLVVNPDAITSEDTYTAADGRLGLSLGLSDESLNITKTLNNILFFVESEASNGKGGTDYWVADYNEEGNIRGLTSVPFNESVDNYLSISTDDKGCEMSSATPIAVLSENGEKYYMILEIGSIVSSASEEDQAKEPTGITPLYNLNNSMENGAFSTSSKYQSMGQASMSAAAKLTAPGIYIYELSRIFNEFPNGGTRNLRLRMSFTKNASFIINKLIVKTIPDGYSFGSTASQYTWRPYSITSSQEYKNGLALTTEDVLTSKNGITRFVTCEAGGTVAMAGDLNGGTATFDADKMIITVAGSGFEYSIYSQKPGTIYYCESEEDLKNSVLTTEQTATSKYWVYTISPVQATDSWYIGIGCGSEAGTTASVAREAANSAKYRQVMGNVETTWNDFINTSKDIGKYIASLGK